MNIALKAYELIGNTPLLEVQNIKQKMNLRSRILVKLEHLEIQVLALLQLQQQKGID